MYFESLLIISTSLCLYPAGAENFNFTFIPNFVPKLLEDTKQNVTLVFNDTSFGDDDCGKWFSVACQPSKNAGAVLDCSSTICEEASRTCNVTLVLNGKFVGLATAHVLYRDDRDLKLRRFGPSLNIQVIRPESTLSNVFMGLMAVMVFINYINMGCAMDLNVIKIVLKRPIGPALGFACQFIIMPLVAYGVGLWLFSDKPILRLGLFTFGCSPGGGASNMWTVLLQGNLNLSITMTFLSTIIALGSIPLWLFILGRDIIEGTKIHIPYDNILISLASMLIALGAGLLIQKYLPRLAAFGKRILSTACIVMIIILVVLGSVSKYYILLMLTWTMVFAAMLNVWLGFMAGGLAAFVFRLSREDVVAVSVETGIQNSGIAFLLLSYSLKPPFSDIASVVPIAASIVTPFPLLFVMCLQKLYSRFWKRKVMTLASMSEKELDYQSKKCENGLENHVKNSDSVHNY